MNAHGIKWTRELKRGSMQICLLVLLSQDRKYGFQIIKELRELTNGYIDLKEGTLYPALQRLEKNDMLKSEWVREGTGNPRRYYSLTQKGKEELAKAMVEWKMFVKSCEEVIKAMS